MSEALAGQNRFRRPRIVTGLSAIVGLSLLMFVARSGESRPLVLFAAGVYGVLAYLWLRHQFWEAAERVGGVWTPRRRWQAALLALGCLGLLVNFTWYENGYLFVASLLVVLVTVGFAELAVRRVNFASKATALWLMGVGGAGLFIGLSFVDRPWSGFALGLMGLSWVGLASGIAIRSEQVASSTVPSQLHDMLPWWAALLAWTVATGAACYLAGSWVMLIPFALVALVMATLAASTMADIVLLTLVVAVMGWTASPAQLPDSFEGSPTAGDGTLVVLGDSYISGEGAERYYDGTDGNTGSRGEANMCRRSPNSWAARLGESEFDHTMFLACSGARTYNVMHDANPDSGDSGVLDPGPQDGEPSTQLDAYRSLLPDSYQSNVADFIPSLVVVSLGGNDAGFSAIGLMCVAPGDCGDRDNLWLDTLPGLERQLGAAFAQIRSAFAKTPVLVATYPDPIHEPKARCDVPLSRDDRRFIVQFVDELNARVESAALAQGFYVITELQESLAVQHRQLCDPQSPDGEPGLNFIGLRSTAGLAHERFSPANWIHNSLHPNKEGHDAMFSVVTEWLDEHRELVAVNPESGYVAPTPLPAYDEMDSQAHEDAEPPCDLFDVPGTAPECRAESTRWALGQVSAQLLSRGYGLLLLIGAVGAWSASLTLFRWRRRKAQERTPNAPKD